MVFQPDNKTSLQAEAASELIHRVSDLEIAVQKNAENLKRCEISLQNIQSLMVKREEQYAARDAEVAELRAAAKKIHALPIVAVSVGSLGLLLGLLSSAVLLRLFA